MKTLFGDIKIKFKYDKPRSYIDVRGRFELQDDDTYGQVAWWGRGEDGRVDLYPAEAFDEEDLR